LTENSGEPSMLVNEAPPPSIQRVRVRFPSQGVCGSRGRKVP